MSAIDVKNLVKKFHGQTVLHGIDLEVEQGEVVAIIGPSGSGKTTLLRSINLLEQPEGGTIRVGEITIDTGKSISQQKGLIRLRQHVGFVFQNFNLFPHRTVLENIIEGPVIVKGEPKRKRRRGRANCSLKSGWRVKRPAIRAACRAGSSSAWRLRARWRCALT
jgi:cystine transport system ATP-binding protein